jgi:hypothetical protein
MDDVEERRLSNIVKDSTLGGKKERDTGTDKNATTQRQQGRSGSNTQSISEQLGPIGMLCRG